MRDDLDGNYTLTGNIDCANQIDLTQASDSVTLQILGRGRPKQP